MHREAQVTLRAIDQPLVRVHFLTAIVASASRSVTYASTESRPSAATSERRSAVSGTCTVTSASVLGLRMVELRSVSETSFSFGITSWSLSRVRTHV